MDIQQCGMGSSSTSFQVCSSQSACSSMHSGNFARAVHTLIPFPYTSLPGTAFTSMYIIGKLRKPDMISCLDSGGNNCAVSSPTQYQFSFSTNSDTHAHSGNSSSIIFCILGFKYMHLRHHLAIQSTTRTASDIVCCQHAVIVEQTCSCC